MSGKTPKPKTVKPKSPKVSKDADLSLDASDASFVDTQAESKQNRRGQRPQSNNNDIIKSRLEVVFDILDASDDVDEKSLRRNVVIALKHLKDVSVLLS